jgi:hypothetical protein
LVHSNVTVTSILADGSVQFAHGSDRLDLLVQVTVRAHAYVDETDVTILPKDDGETVLVSGARVPAGTGLIVTVQTRDCDRLVIERSDQSLELVLTWGLGGYNSSIKLLPAGHSQPGLFKAEVPGTLLATTGSYSLRVVVLTEGWSGVSVSFKVVDPSRKALIFGTVAAVLLGGLLVVMLILAYRNRERMKEVVKSFLKLEFRTAAELIVDVWDFYGASLSGRVL